VLRLSRAFLGAARMQYQISRRDPGDLMLIALAPLDAIVFLAIIKNAHRSDLLGYALLAPVLLALWTTTLWVSGEMIDRDRAEQTLEAMLVTPAPFPIVMVSRILAVTALTLVAFIESGLVGRLVFGVTLIVHHPGVFALTLAVTSLATASTGLVMSAIFVLGRSVRTFQSSLSYPFYVLGGILVPVSYLPPWLQPVTKLIFLSWASDLLRDAIKPAPVVAAPLRLGVVLILGILTFILGWLLLGRIVMRVRGLGTINYA
jgi:ABC-2 type transport system permease protein